MISDSLHPEPGSVDIQSEGRVDLLGFVQRHLRAFGAVTAIGALLTAALVAASLLLPPTARLAVVDIVPTFVGAKERVYPNGTPFSPQDIVAQSVVEPVWRAQGLETAIPIADLCRSISIQDGGTQLELLRSDYMQRLANARLTAAERGEIEAEFASKLKAIGGSTQTITIDGTAGRLADAQLAQLLLAIPAEWARSSDAAGARSYDFPLPLGRELRASAQVLGQDGSAVASVLHAERMKDFIDSLTVAITSMRKLAGSDAARDSKGASLVDLAQEVAATRRNLVTPSYLDALARARASDRDGYEALRSTRRKLLETELQAAKERSRVLRESFAAYADQTGGVAKSQRNVLDDARQSALTANVDGTFIDRVIEQAVNSRDIDYRRKFMERLVEAELSVTNENSRFEFEQWLDKTAQERADGGQKSSPVALGLVDVTDKVASFADRGQEIMQVLAARNLNSTSTMYRVDLPPVVQKVPAWPLRSAVLAGFGIWAASMALVATVALLDDRRRARRFERLDPALLADARRDAAESAVAARLADQRSAPRRLPDERRQPVG